MYEAHFARPGAAAVDPTAPECEHGGPAAPIPRTVLRTHHPAPASRPDSVFRTPGFSLTLSESLGHPEAVLGRAEGRGDAQGIRPQSWSERTKIAGRGFPIGCDPRRSAGRRRTFTGGFPSHLMVPHILYRDSLGVTRALFPCRESA